MSYEEEESSIGVARPSPGSRSESLVTGEIPKIHLLRDFAFHRFRSFLL